MKSPELARALLNFTKVLKPATDRERKQLRDYRMAIKQVAAAHAKQEA